MPKPRKGLPQLDDFLQKSYMLDYSENYEEFLRELGVPRNTRILAMNSEPTVTLFKTNDEYLLSTSYPEGRVVKVRFKIGEEMHRPRPCDGDTRSVFEVFDNKLLEVQYVDGKKVVVEREFREKDLVITMEVKDVKCCRWYKEVKTASVPSFGTETSRRMSIWADVNLPPSPVVEEQSEEEIETPENFSSACL